MPDGNFAKQLFSGGKGAFPRLSSRFRFVAGFASTDSRALASDKLARAFANVVPKRPLLTHWMLPSKGAGATSFLLRRTRLPTAEIDLAPVIASKACRPFAAVGVVLSQRAVVRASTDLRSRAEVCATSGSRCSRSTIGSSTVAQLAEISVVEVEDPKQNVEAESHSTGGGDVARSSRYCPGHSRKTLSAPSRRYGLVHDR